MMKSNLQGITPSFTLVDYRDITCDGENSTNTKKILMEITGSKMRMTSKLKLQN